MTDKLALAQAAFDAGQTSKAMDLLNEILAVAPEAPAVLLFAQTLAKSGLRERAIEAFLIAAQLGAARDVALAQAARLSLEGEDDQQTLEIASSLRDECPGHCEAAFVLAKLGVKHGNKALVDEVKNELVASEDPEHLLFCIDLIATEVINENNLVLFAKLRRLFPEDGFIRFALLGYAREFCAYDILHREHEALARDIAAGHEDILKAESPHFSIIWTADERLNRMAANIGPIAEPPRDSGPRRWAMPHSYTEKIRVGYLSSDLWDDHATMRLFQGVLHAHDRDRFDVTLYCHTPDFRLAFDRGGRTTWGPIVQVGKMSDVEVVERVRCDGIDILVDLKGHTEDSRSQIMNLPAAPVHVQWLGFPGSCLRIDCDYIIGDRFVLPDSSKPFYHEKFCRLPESYQPNDCVARPLPEAPSRRTVGVPADRFVFGAFHSQRKNGLEGLSIWAEVLRANPEALLWLLIEGNGARRATAEEFRSLGVKPGQLLFAPRVPYRTHLARAQAADLAIDSFPCNGHTTTSDMLWVGLPVVTMRGTNFASRVSESLLNAIDLPELVAPDRTSFVELCTDLVRDRERLSDLRQRVINNRFSAPLFDSERFCRHLEDAYGMMVGRAKAGLAPDHFDVPARPRRTSPFRQAA